MKKLISLIAAMSYGHLAFAQLINVQDPASKGLVRTIPYTSDWSQKWLTNTSVSTAAAQLAPYFANQSAFSNITVNTITDPSGTYPASTNMQRKTTLFADIAPSVITTIQPLAGLSVNSVSTPSGIISTISNTVPNAVVIALPGGGVAVSASSLVNNTITYSVSATGTNQVTITNLNAATLSGYGALTTNATYTTFQQLTNLGIVLTNTWQYYCDAANAYTNAKAYTNGLLSSSVAAATYQAIGSYQPLGTYLTPSSSLNYGNITNQPAPYTNFSIAFVGTLYVTNETATTSSVTTANVTTGNITNANVTTLVATNARIGTANVSSNLTAYNVTVTNAVTLPAFQASAGTTNAFCVDSNGNAIAVSFANMRTFMQQTNYVFDSTNLVAGDMAIANFSHGFSATPSYVKWVLVCTTTNASYSVGDEVDFTAFTQTGPNRTLTYGYNSTKIWAVKGGSFSAVLSKIDGNAIQNGTAPTSLDQTLWKARCYYRP